ncbi:peptidyl-alpha-hydroxyglycine alpha-amidating lyase family protein [Paraburkholderia sp. MM5477-R1]|uniref:peptidyl-alpha-hydroxyglycine alpha-amidating lyase family protein n=1 Tax=Paraburkholderia sp. MM5477-R1 TaxID=2991062 RepID=UPI003D1C9D0F
MFAYEHDQEWAKLPKHVALGEVGGVAVDNEDRVYVFNRGEHPIIVFDRSGEFRMSWGHGVFKRPHGIHIGPDNSVYCTDEGDHTVRKFSPDGRLLLEIGTPHRPSTFMSGLAFNRCTHTALSPEGNIYVSDGYGNARIHIYSPDGKPLKSWGGPGTDPGQFNVPHNICADPDGWVYVADRENHRIQVFDRHGKYETQWNNLHRPCALCMDRNSTPTFFIGEAATSLAVNREYPNLGPRISIMNRAGQLVGRYGDDRPGFGPNQFIAPHGMAVDSAGDLYVGEVSHTAWLQMFPGKEMPADIRTFRKLVRVPVDNDLQTSASPARTVSN